MYSINKNVENTLLIKKSKFIAKIYKINNINEIKKILEYEKNKHKNSTHICYAYIINGQEKCIDNGEPSGTAGLPILNILKNNNLTNVIAIVIRYFGGIKLGASGLVRAYSNSITEALKLTDIIELQEGYLIEIEFNYEQVKLLNYMLENKNIIEKIYNSNIIYKLYLSNEELFLIPELEKIAIHISIKDKILIEKK